MQQISWDPVFVDYQLPWESKLLVVYLFVVLIISLLQSIGLLRQLWSFRVDSAEIPRHSASKLLFGWRRCVAKTEGMKRLSLATFLLSVLATSRLAERAFIVFAGQTFVGSAVLYATFAEILKPFTLGVLVCVILYGVSGVFHCTLMRRRASWDYFLAPVLDGVGVPGSASRPQA